MLVMTLFVIIVLAFLGATLVNLLAGTNQSVVFEVLGARAKFSAQSGLDKIVATAFPLNSSVANCASTLSSSSAFSNSNGLVNCSYEATCTTTPITKDSVDYYYYRFESVGLCQAGDIWVSRTFELDAFEEQ